MKNKNHIVFILLACAIIISTIISTMFICYKIDSTMNTLNVTLSNFSGKISSLSQNGQNTAEEDVILSVYEAASYLNADVEVVRQMIESGELQGTYFETPDGGYSFVKEKLYQWCLSHTE